MTSSLDRIRVASSACLHSKSAVQQIGLACVAECCAVAAALLQIESRKANIELCAVCMLFAADCRLKMGMRTAGARLSKH